jgi:hypothetical protein
MNSNRESTLESLWCIGVLTCRDYPTTLPQSGWFANHSKSFIHCYFVICAFTYRIVELMFVMSYIVGGHKMHIFTANILIFHSRYRRYVLITNEFYKFCWSTILGTSDDGKAPYEQKSIHILITSKTRGVHGEYDTKGWHGTRPEPTWPSFMAGRPAWQVGLTHPIFCQSTALLIL